jgi:hypothetical protein
MDPRSGIEATKFPIPVYVSCCDPEEGSDTETCDCISYLISSLYMNVFKRFWTCDLTFSPSGDVNPHDVVHGGLRSSHMSGEWFTTLCYLSSKIRIFDFFHVQGLNIFASTLSNFRWSFRGAWTADFSFLSLYYSQCPYRSYIKHFFVSIPIGSIPRSGHDRESWSPRIGDWNARIGIFKFLSKDKRQYLNFFDENQNYPRWKLWIITCCLYRNLNILISSISTDYTSLQGPYQLFIGRLARFGRPISHFIESDTYMNFV